MQNQVVDAIAIIRNRVVVTSHNRLTGASHGETNRVSMEIEITNIAVD